ncbi:oxygenase MpaB family protein [Actinomycetospora lemnae]|uniref:Oxygenase MpaB family protein n=1 Tax=Actinomycetospora lemnae TaxID=3019891 RepID=A0ABT5SN20_9PSEU|nr:oxygenase MpaB family protein [Actinomycetospora sp. DW7H6]MDD7963875.1 oxygenase MpaB family protein [Actinomycetospora sp. DW7H6]
MTDGAGDLGEPGELGDLGLFGPTSVTWRVQLEPVLWVAGMRALLLQSLHPQVMRATFQNSALFDPKKAWPRFQRTVGFVGTRTFGTRADVEAAGSRVRRLHATLRGRDPDGTEIALDDPENLLWVHNAEIDSYVDVARRAGVVDDAEADAYVAESVRAAEVVGLDPAIVPASRAELAAYFDRVRPRLRLTDEARRGVGGLLTPQPSAPTGIALTLSSIAAISFSTLPRWARRMYGLPGLPTTDLGVTLALRALYRATTLLPDLPAPPDVDRARRLVREARAAG